MSVSVSAATVEEAIAISMSSVVWGVVRVNRYVVKVVVTVAKATKVDTVEVTIGVGAVIVVWKTPIHEHAELYLANPEHALA